MNRLRNGPKPILVTGSHRSGSTWVGNMLAFAPCTRYVHEPFNVGIKNSVTSNVFKFWFQHVDEEETNLYKPAMDQAMRYRYPLARSLVRVRSAQSLARVMNNQWTNWLQRVNGYTPILKDPVAIFSAEWLHRTYDMNVVVVIRHPAAFCSSLKLKNWRFDFNHFLDQDRLMEKYLGRFEREIREQAERPKDILEQAILLWNCFHHTITLYSKKHPEWLFKRHEDLSLDPVREFQSIYKAFGLEFTDEVKSKILEASGAHNPTEQQEGKEFVRNSKENVRNWKRRLSPEEIELIRIRTLPVHSAYYPAEDW